MKMTEASTRSSDSANYRVFSSKESSTAGFLRFRTPRSGPEDLLVDDFLLKSQISIPSGLELTFFREPWLESGAPDLVGVLWDRCVVSTWSQNRKDLSKSDLRIIHYLTEMGATRYRDLEKIFQRKASKSVDKLEAANMAVRDGDLVVPNAITNIYAIRHIFAIEAKMTSYSAALQQAFRNLWFATSSYILVPKLPKKDSVQATARDLSVGIISSDSWTVDLRPMIFTRSPASYCSWLFNEWTWQAEHLNYRYAECSSTMGC